jgi:hypothetical protein
MNESLDFDAPFKSFQKRLRAGELRTPDLNDSNRRLYGLPSQLVQREAFIGARELPSEADWELQRKQRILQG